jgi:hypothetical protein
MKLALNITPVGCGKSTGKEHTGGGCTGCSRAGSCSSGGCSGCGKR